jgi:precorrin-8X/cobalt-precorrin-8 methylmutase
MGKPEDIENLSFKIIEKKADLSKYNLQERFIVKKLIHTTGDLDFANNTIFSPNAIDVALEALKSRVPVICDTNMVKAGITRRYLDYIDIKLYCYINYKIIVKRAKEINKTRAEMAIDYCKNKFDKAIFAIGNAPTALNRLLDLYISGEIKPILIIGLPVGFVGAEESKKRLLKQSELAYITNIGPKGGSACAATVINSLIMLCKEYSKL